jgi:dihydrofolate synthase/folylpolyglutamate synthase
MSPHLERINERISKDLEPIGDDDFFELLVALETLETFVLSSGALEIPPTWFELITAAAYRYFADSAVDAAVVEVGLGGRFDATNVIDADVAVVTNVALDHVEILGPTRSHIAREKAGIIKPDATVVIGEEDDEIVEIFAEEARSVGAANLWRSGHDFACIGNMVAIGGRLLDIRTPGQSYDGQFLALHGAHQGLNATLALCAVEAFFGAPLHEDVVAEAFARVTVPGRLEVMSRQPLVILDGAHNPAGATMLGQSLREDFAGVERIVVVIGCLRGRNPRELLVAMGIESVAEIICCEPASPRAQSAEAVADTLRDLGRPVHVVSDVADALVKAKSLAGEADAVLVTGSLYVVGAARGAVRRLASHVRE